MFFSPVWLDLFFENDDGCNDSSFFIFKLNWTCTQQIEEELNGANVNLQTAREQIGDLNLQVTILNSGKKKKWKKIFLIFFLNHCAKKSEQFYFICIITLRLDEISEMGVLRQKLTEREDERGQLERKVTELSATVSSTLASYTFLEQALASETTKYDPCNNKLYCQK